ncbi:hypothetical protein [Polaribacter butkevichii]|nr:hypothetical protein [Polaribacter butkevichii]
MGLEVLYVHIYLVPTNTMEDIQFIKKVKFINDGFVVLVVSSSNQFE